MELFKLDPGLAIWTWVAFGFLFFILWKFAFPALMGNIRDRERLIAKSVDDAESIEKRLEDINIEYAGIIKKARMEADGILLDTRKESDVLKKKLLEKAEHEAAEIIVLAKERLTNEREALLLTLRGEIADLICDTSAKLVGTSFTLEEDRKWALKMAETL